MKVGFIGLGAMGQGIAANILKAGHGVIAWNRSPAPVEALAALGATPAAKPKISKPFPFKAAQPANPSKVDNNNSDIEIPIS